MSGPSPSGYTTVAPWIVTRDTGRLLDFITAVFGGTELARVALEDGSIGHAEIRVGDTVLLAFDRRPGWPDAPALLRVFVEDADATMSRAVAAGARVVTRPRTHAFGQRTGRVRDPLGNIWWISAVVEEVAPDEIMRRLAEPEYAEAMRDAQETLDRELSGGGSADASPPVVRCHGGIGGTRSWSRIVADSKNGCAERRADGETRRRPNRRVALACPARRRGIRGGRRARGRAPSPGLPRGSPIT
jgi:PhnB protein